MVGVRQIGRYEVVRHLASGGMGQVYLARATGLGGFVRQVVIKTLELGTEDDEALAAMFLDEARLHASLHHHAIAPVFEVGCDEDRYFLVMEYVHGETAEAVFRAVDERGLKAPLGLALAVGTAIASALAHAHTQCTEEGTHLGIVHRDVTPANIMIGYDGGVRLIDFGIAKSVQRTHTTRAGALKGNLGYLAPEQVLRQDIDARADLFALGCVLYELTCARRAFRDRSEFITLERIVTGTLTPPSELVPDFLPELERIILKALERDPDHRYQDAVTMGRDLEALASRHSLSLGHTAVAEVMSLLFTAASGRRRTARGSSPQQPVTPTTDILDAVPPVVMSPDTERMWSADTPT